MIQEQALNSKLDAIKTYKSFTIEEVEQFGNILSKLEEDKLRHLNPYTFSKENNFSEEQCIELFIHAAKVGLLDFSYNLVCPACGGIVSSRKDFQTIQDDKFHCAACNLDTTFSLDDQIEVDFSIHPGIKKLKPVSLQKFEQYYRSFFSLNFVKASQINSYIMESIAAYGVIEADSTKEFSIEKSETDICRFISIENNAAIEIVYSSNLLKGEETQEAQFVAGSFSPSLIELRAHKLNLTIKNLSKKPISIILYRPEKKRIMELFIKNPIQRKKFLTAKDLFNNQSFRELFRVQLSDGFNLNVKSLTIMFTDLRGSTEMYDKAGDHMAYKLVQEHFEILMRVVKLHSGAIIKTMGDAIMATFSNRIDGFLAAREMMKRIQEMNESWKKKGYELGLKVGLNEGSALAVNNDERIDYFGQAVNIAARVQGLAKAGEIWISDSIYSFPGVAEKILENHYLLERQEASLKGVGGKATVYRVYVN